MIPSVQLSTISWILIKSSRRHHWAVIGDWLALTIITQALKGYILNLEDNFFTNVSFNNSNIASHTHYLSEVAGELGCTTVLRERLSSKEAYDRVKRNLRWEPKEEGIRLKLIIFIHISFIIFKVLYKHLQSKTTHY